MSDTVRPQYADVTEPLGPGLELEADPDTGRLVAMRTRERLGWLGLDRAEVVESDDGTGRTLRALVALPVSTYAGCRVRVTWWAAVQDDRGAIVVGAVDGMAPPLPAVARTVGRMPDGRWLDAEAAGQLVADARRRYRTRRAADRITGGRAWEPRIGSLEDARFTSPHARSEYTLARLPPRFLRGLRHLLDPDERVLYAVERPAITQARLTDRVARRLDRRAALLVLTDRQVAWVVDHADPDRYLSDWGVDVELVPLERLTGVHSTADARSVRLAFTTGQGVTHVALPPEYEAEAGIMAGLAGRFTASACPSAPRRTYPVDVTEPDWSRAATFRQEDEARALHAAIGPSTAAVLLSPRRPGQRTPELWAVAAAEVRSATPSRTRSWPLGVVHALRVVLSPLAGRLELVGAGAQVGYPGSLSDMAADLVRAARRVMACT